jgi:hypothetical protein
MNEPQITRQRKKIEGFEETGECEFWRLRYFRR